MKKATLAVGIIISLGMVPFPGYGADGAAKPQTPPQAQLQAQKLEIKTNPQLQMESKKGVEEQKAKLENLKQTINQEVKIGLDKVQQAIITLDRSNPQEALKLVKEAVGSFDIALAANPNLGMVPVGSVVNVHELYSDPAIIKQQISLAKELLDDGHVQAARSVLIPLRSDVSESVTYLPMATYPAAIRVAVRQITDHQIDKAKETLAGAMNTMVVANERLVPIPVLTARSLVDEASKMDKTKKEDVAKKLDEAQNQLKIAQLLGYQTKNDEYRNLKADIDKLQAEVKGQNRVEKLYKDLNSRFSAWIEKMTSALTSKTKE